MAAAAASAQRREGKPLQGQLRLQPLEAALSLEEDLMLVVETNDERCDWRSTSCPPASSTMIARLAPNVASS